MRRFSFLLLVVAVIGCGSEDIESPQPGLVFSDAGPTDLSFPGDVTALDDGWEATDLKEIPDNIAAPDACVPLCDERLCGDDGCGGSCGACAQDEFCAQDGQCYCQGCQDRKCGLDPCSGLLCGMCPGAMECNPEGQCYVPCVPECGDRCCGDDGCGGECPDFCGEFGVSCDQSTCRCEPFSACGEPAEPPICETVSRAPQSWVDVKSFIRLNSVPLRCTIGERNWWDFAVVERDFDAKRLFMFGEVHGSQELGPMSAALFEHLVRAGLIDSFSIEIGVDTTDPMNEYIRTGAGPLVTDYAFDYWPRKMMWTELVAKARELHLEGYETTAFGCDTPMRLQYVNEEIEAIAERLVETRTLVLDSLPQPGPEVWQEVSYSYLTDADEYSEQIQANRERICAELDDEILCERLVIMAETVWLGAFSAYSGTHNTNDRFFYQFLRRREPLIYHSYRFHMGDGQRVYTHMGAFHTAKTVDPQYSYASAGSRLANEWEPTQGLVFTTTPNYGSGSQIRYGGEIMNVSPDPSVVADALEDEEIDRYYVPLNRPGADCRATPLEDEQSSTTGADLGETYDAMMFVKKLTPEGSAYKSALPLPIRAALTHLEAVREAESRLMKGALR